MIWLIFFDFIYPHLNNAKNQLTMKTFKFLKNKYDVELLIDIGTYKDIPYYFFESEMAIEGEKIVRNNIGKIFNISLFVMMIFNKLVICKFLIIFRR